ncbi:MAG: hypothetical protein H7831_12445, partial [Magnetococcus sp. WYHC-3]
MAIKRYVAEADTTISNAFRSDLTNTATGSNMGEADVMDIFHIYAQASTSSHEVSRALLKFPVSEMSQDRTDGVIPASGSAYFYLRLYNTPHSFTTPRKIT